MAMWIKHSLFSDIVNYLTAKNNKIVNIVSLFVCMLSVNTRDIVVDGRGISRNLASLIMNTYVCDMILWTLNRQRKMFLLISRQLLADWYIDQ